MWFQEPIRGNSLPPNTLALTFDDGPGPDTLEIAQYLAALGIEAAFFLVGKYIQRFPDSVAQLLALGHIVGNHAFHHFHLTNSHSSVTEIVSEVELTDYELRKTGKLSESPLFFRPPYGAWSPRLAYLLNRHGGSCRNYLGAIHWDIGGDDFEFWKAGRAPEECSSYYQRSIDGSKSRSGIVLLHDNTADIPATDYQNRTFEMVQLLVPALMSKGFGFSRLDFVPSVRRAMREQSPFSPIQLGDTARRYS